MNDHPRGVGGMYLPLGAADDGSERFLPTDYTRSVWSTDMQHGSPPAALMLRAIERGLPHTGMEVSRVTVELLGVVPVTETRVRARVLRPGRNIELVTAELACDSGDGTFRTAATATAWRLAVVDTAAAECVHGDPLRVEEAIGHHGFDRWGQVPGTSFLDAFEWEWLTLPEGDTPGRVWTRPVVTLVDGEEPSDLEHMFSVIDAANGVGATLQPGEWTFLNTEMTVHLFRAPVGREIGIEAGAGIGPHGYGACSGVIHDSRGPVARTNQSLLVRPRA